MRVNTGRGAVVDTRAVIRGLESGTIGSLGPDVCEEEEEAIFFEDFSDRFIADDVFARLLTFPNVHPNVLVTFFAAEALAGIAETTIANLTAFERNGRPLHPVAAR